MEEQRQKVIDLVTSIMRYEHFNFELKVCKNPKGLKITYELTQEQLDAIMNS